MHHIPRWAFIQCLSVLGKLSTKDRLSSWGIKVDPRCDSCSKEDESHPQLSFSCSYATTQVWSAIPVCNGITNGPVEFLSVLSRTKQFRCGNSMAHIVFKLSFAATIYWLWREINGRVFQNQSLGCSSLQGIIVDDIRVCLSSWRGVKYSSQNLAIAAAWRISRKIFSSKLFWGLVVDWLFVFLVCVSGLRSGVT